jgi:hypothetical protein
MRYRYAPLAVLAIPVVISVALWRGSAPQTKVAYENDCNARDPLAGCYVQPRGGIEVDGLVFNDVELQSASIGDHSLAVVRFAPKASQDDIAKFLDRNKASVVEGPKSDGLYTLRLPATGEAKVDLIKQMQANSSIVEFIANVQ